MAKEVIVILGNQLVPNHPALRKHPDAMILMCEADDLCRKHFYHTHKLMLLLSSMRSYRDGLDRPVEYVELEQKSVFKKLIADHLKALGATTVIWMHASDRGPNRMLEKIAFEISANTIVYPNKQFVTTTQEFGGWLDGQTAKTPLMETFYRWQRKRLKILMDGTKPEGGLWNYDHDNRSALPKSGLEIPPLTTPTKTTHTKAVAELMHEHYADHPGSPDDFWLPTTRSDAKQWLASFIDQRLGKFGAYEDAMRKDEPFLFHSVLSPLINLGLLTPRECVDATLEAYESGVAPLKSIEGFVRQIIGWREFMYGLYWWKSDEFDGNFFGHQKKLERWWYDGLHETIDLPPPLADSLSRVHSYGYSHHIERLMVFGNWFLLSGYSPDSVYDWFMSMYVDAYEWVMIPNVRGMSQYADGGMLATKPYVSGGNYLQKMGRWWDSDKAARESEYTTLYWDFIYRNRAKFENNHRMSLIVAQARKKFES